MLEKNLEKLDSSLIVIPNSSCSEEKQIEFMFWNLWGQFGITKYSKKAKTLNVKNFSWTKQAKDEFYAISFHKRLLEQLKKRLLYSSWELDCEPLEHSQTNQNIKMGKRINLATVSTQKKLKLSREINTLMNRYEYGDVKKARAMRGNELSQGQAELAGSLSKFISIMQVFGTKQQQSAASIVLRVENSRLWTRVHILKGATIVQKQALRQMIVDAGYLFYDKPYQWTKKIGTFTESLNLGPWSVNPWYMDKGSKQGKVINIVKTKKY